MSSSAARLIALVVALGLATAALVGGTGRAAAAADCRFVLGFEALHAMIPDTVGACVENEQHHPGQGVTHQRTTNGLLVWQKASNHTAFTDGYRTWISGPLGLQQRLNSEQFDWERDLAAAYTVATVEQAVARYRSEGREASIAYHSSMESVDGRWYVFILEAATGTVLAHPANVYVGQDLTVGSEAYDDAGYYYAGDLIKATPEGIFVRDVLGVPTRDEQNPFHTIEEVKHYYAVLEDGLIFASGWYTPAPTKEDPAEYARLLVGRALTRYDDTGHEATLAHYNDPASADGPWYVFIIEERDDGRLYSVAHSTRPDLVGTTRERIDANGFNYGEAFAAVTETGGGEWVSYLFTHPETREDAPKHSWIVRRGNLLFGVGWYEGIE